MPRLTHAPNLAIATLWADLLKQAGIDATVQGVYASGIAGQIPPDQAQPEVWVAPDVDLARAQALLDNMRAPVEQIWTCTECGEVIEGPFEECWNCGAAMPP